MERINKFLLTDEKNSLTYFSFLHSSGRLRSFTYSGIFDISTEKGTLVINHASTKILVSGAGLNKIHMSLMDYSAKIIFENEGATDKEGNLYKVTDIIYFDEIEK